MCNSRNSVEKYCKCGCGEKIKIKPYHKYDGIPDYINHHYNKTKEARLEVKERWNNPDSIYNTPEYRAAIGKGGKNKIITPEYRKKLSLSKIGEKNPNYGGVDEETRLKLISNLKSWAEKNPGLYIKHQKNAGKRGAFATHKVQRAKGFISKPERTMKSWLPPDFLHGKEFLGTEPDFRSETRKIIIEVDGVYWHNMRKEDDVLKDKLRRLQGYSTYRFTDLQILNQPGAVKSKLNSCGIKIQEEVGKKEEKL